MPQDYPDFTFTTHVRTLAADNIIIDKLTVGAYTENRRTLQNHGDTAQWASPTGTVRHGKFFPRGARGNLNAIWMYVRNTDPSTQTLKLWVTPMPGMGPVAEASLTIPGNTPPSWVTEALRIPWNYDSLFIFWQASSPNLEVALDLGEPYDNYSSDDEGVTWLAENSRSWVKLDMTAQTVGDVPVSGTINAIQIPSLSGTRSGIALSVPSLSEKYDTPQEGTGRTLIVMFHAYSADAMTYLVPRIRSDGVLVLPFDATFDAWHDRYIGENTPGITIGKWDTTINRYTIVVTIKFPFKRKLEVGFYNRHDTLAWVGIVAYTYEKIG